MWLELSLNRVFRTMYRPVNPSVHSIVFNQSHSNHPRYFTNAAEHTTGTWEYCQCGHGTNSQAPTSTQNPLCFSLVDSGPSGVAHSPFQKGKASWTLSHSSIAVIMCLILCQYVYLHPHSTSLCLSLFRSTATAGQHPPPAAGYRVDLCYLWSSPALSVSKHPKHAYGKVFAFKPRIQLLSKQSAEPKERNPYYPPTYVSVVPRFVFSISITSRVSAILRLHPPFLSSASFPGSLAISIHSLFPFGYFYKLPDLTLSLWGPLDVVKMPYLPWPRLYAQSIP